MLIDPTTHRDLTLFADRSGGGGLFAHLDRTATAGGRERLRARFGAPLRDPAEIRATQDALRFATRHADWFRAGVEATTAAAVEHYLASPIEPVADARGVGAMVERAWVGTRYPELVSLARIGVPATAHLLQALHALAGTVLRHDPPPLLRTLAGDAISLLDTPALRPLLALDGASLGAGRALALDALLRTTAREPVRRARAVLAELEALGAMATVTVELGFTYPEVLDDDGPPRLELTGAWHPFVTGAVPNDLVLGPDRRLLFLTGPNMAGKTTYLRAAGLALVLAHLGMGVPAAAMRFTPFDALVTSLGTEDDVRLGYSYFYAEVRRVREIAERLAAGERCAVLVDEVFKGTNVKDALDASSMVLHGFAASTRSVYVVSSHLAELADAIGAEPGVALACFGGRLDGGRATYDYRVREGASAQRMGLVLLEEAGVAGLLAAARG